MKYRFCFFNSKEKFKAAASFNYVSGFLGEGREERVVGLEGGREGKRSVGRKDGGKLKEEVGKADEEARRD